MSIYEDMLYLLHHDTKHVLVTHTITSRSRRGPLAYIYIYIFALVQQLSEQCRSVTSQELQRKLVYIYICVIFKTCVNMFDIHINIDLYIYHSRQFLNVQQSEIDAMVLKHAIHKSFNFAQLQNVLLPIVIAS